MGKVIRFPGKPREVSTPHKPKPSNIPIKEVVISLNTYADLSVAWGLLKQLSLITTPNRNSLTVHQQELLAMADHMPADPGNRKQRNCFPPQDRA
jgi:hypothetical protein